MALDELIHCSDEDQQATTLWGGGGFRLEGAKGICDTVGNQQSEAQLMLATVASHHGATCWRRCGTEEQVAVWEVQVGFMLILNKIKMTRDVTT